VRISADLAPLSRSLERVADEVGRMRAQRDTSGMQFALTPATQPNLLPGDANAQVLLACAAALPLGLVLDRWFGLLPALSARCGGSQTLWASLEWHRACMPATCLAMLFAPPAWIGLKAMMRALSPSVSQHDCRHATFAACGCHLAMMAGMAGVLGIGPSLAALVGLPWTGGVAIGAMALGMVGGMGAAGLVTGTQSALSLSARGRGV
jgi:hypothetical protein